MELVPVKIQELIANKPFIVDDIGMSGNQVLIFEDTVLKIEDSSASIDQQVQTMQWLDGKIPVPQMLLEALACGLQMLWEVDIKDCPRIRDLDVLLQEARVQVENDLVDLDNVEPTTFGEGGFENPKHLLEWLESHRPSFEPVLSHGDFCLPNIFLENEKMKGFIDLGKTGVGDKWNDIALCYRSLKHNFDGSYGGKVYDDFQPEMLFEKLGIVPDWEKIKYYLLLDELF